MHEYIHKVARATELMLIEQKRIKNLAMYVTACRNEQGCKPSYIMKLVAGIGKL